MHSKSVISCIYGLFWFTMKEELWGKCRQTTTTTTMTWLALFKAICSLHTSHSYRIRSGTIHERPSPFDHLQTIEGHDLSDHHDLKYKRKYTKIYFRQKVPKNERHDTKPFKITCLPQPGHQTNIPLTGSWQRKQSPTRLLQFLQARRDLAVEETSSPVGWTGFPHRGHDSWML